MKESFEKYIEAAKEYKVTKKPPKPKGLGKIKKILGLPDNAVNVDKLKALEERIKKLEDRLAKEAKAKGEKPPKLEEIIIDDKYLKEIKPPEGIVNWKAIESHDKKIEMSSDKTDEPNSPNEAMKPAKTSKPTVAEQILRFIASKGSKGAGLSEIQQFIVESADRPGLQNRTFQGHHDRGIYATNLYGSVQTPGLFAIWCEKSGHGQNWKIKDGAIIAPPFYRRSPMNQVEDINIPESKYAKMIQKAYRLNKPLSYMEIVELLQTGQVGKWGPKERRDNRGWGATNLNKKWGNVLHFFKKEGPTGSKGKYKPIESLRDKVMSGDFQPFGDPGPRRIEDKEWEKTWRKRRKTN